MGSSYELIKDYVKSTKKIIQTVNHYPALEDIKNDFKDIISKRKEWICSLAEIQVLMVLLSKNAEKTFSYAREINPNVTFQLSSNFIFDIDDLEPRDLAFMIEVHQMNENELKISNNALSLKGMALLSPLLRDKTFITEILLSDRRKIHLPAFRGHTAIFS